MAHQDLPIWKRFLSALKPGQVFAARTVIGLGKPETIYKRLSRLVDVGFLVRVAKGVYMRASRTNPNYLPPLEEIAAVKLKAFGRTAITHEKDLMAALQEVPLSERELLIHGSGTFTDPGSLPPPNPSVGRSASTLDEQPERLENQHDRSETESEYINKASGDEQEEPALIYDINSSTSQFGTVRGLVRLKRVNARKLTLGDSCIGKVLRAWWSLGEHNVGEYQLLQGYKLMGMGHRQRKEIRRHLGLVPNWLNRLIAIGDRHYVLEYARGP